MRRGSVPSPGRLGLLDSAAAHNLALLGWNAEESTDIAWALSRAPDADLALKALVRLREALGGGWYEVAALIAGDKGFRGRLFGVLGSSDALGDHLVAEPEAWRVLVPPTLPNALDMRTSMLAAVDAHPDPSAGPDDLVYRAGVTGPAAIMALRRAYRDNILVIAAHDVAATVQDEPAVTIPVATALLADLADAALTATLAVAIAGVCDDKPLTVRLAVIAMGKCGARELNYVSDVDIIFVGAEADSVTTRVAGEMMRFASDTFFEVDAALRPEGKAGQLVRTLDSHIAYYQRWAKTWEFQALLKARAAVGDPELGRAYIDALMPMVWNAREREDFVPDVQAMRRRVEALVPAEVRDRELKLGTGGLRDVEFAVQLLQLVHGRNDTSLQVASTVDALGALAAAMVFHLSID